MISKSLFKGLFPSSEIDPERLYFARETLKTHGLLGKNMKRLDDVVCPLPPLLGSIQDHLHALGQDQSGDDLRICNELRVELPPMPDWQPIPGWVRYTLNGHESVDFPLEEGLVFDVEVFYKTSNYPCIAVAVSPKAWYLWTSPSYLNETPCDSLIPFGSSHKVIVGHHVAYDRARIREEYDLKSNPISFVDTMSLHCSIAGLSTQQRNQWTKSQKEKKEKAFLDSDASDDTSTPSPSTEPIPSPSTEAIPFSSNQDTTPASSLPDNLSTNDAIQGFNEGFNEEIPREISREEAEGVGEMIDFDDLNEEKEVDWKDVSSPNSLASAVKLHLDLDLDKGLRNEFESNTLVGTATKFKELAHYCAKDVQATHALFCSLLPKFLAKCPHPASFAGMIHMGKSYLTVSEDWNQYIQNAETACNSYQDDIEKGLLRVAHEAIETNLTEDPWLKHLDWTLKPTRMTKPKINKKGEITEPARMYKSSNMALVGKPQWYCDLWDSELKRPRLTISKRCVPYLLRVRWNGYPVYHSKSFGWTFVVPKDSLEPTLRPSILAFSTDENDPSFDPVGSFDQEHFYVRIPHPNGEGYNCGNPLSKGYIQAFDSGALSADYAAAKDILKMNASCSYWISTRERVKSQFVVWQNESSDFGIEPIQGKAGVILPQSVCMGTVTRRAVEPTWMTASNAKLSRIGSELKSKIVAPKGYKFVGADVDSQELWIASLLGDSQFGIHGATAIGFMTLQGTKSAGTDLHSVTGSILGISRDQAKVFNYSRIYGAGVKHAVQLLMQNDPALTKEKAYAKAQELYIKTKGKAVRVRGPAGHSYWSGGSESFMFNQLEHVANSESPRTPVLDCEIPDSLLPRNVKTQVVLDDFSF